MNGALRSALLASPWCSASLELLSADRQRLVDHKFTKLQNLSVGAKRQSFRVLTALGEAEQSLEGLLPRGRGIRMLALGDRGVKHHREVLGSVQCKRHVA